MTPLEFGSDMGGSIRVPAASAASQAQADLRLIPPGVTPRLVDGAGGAGLVGRWRVRPPTSTVP
jgi:hypothetical protein